MSYLDLIEKGNYYAKNDGSNAISTRVFGIILRLPTMVGLSIDNLRSINLKNSDDRDIFITNAHRNLNILKRGRSPEKIAEIEDRFKEAVNTLLEGIV